MYIHITDNKEGIRGAYFDADIANQISQNKGLFVTRISISDQTNIPYAKMLEDAKFKMTSTMRHGKMIPSVIEKHVVYEVFEELFAKLIVKAERYDKIIEIMDKCYEEDSTSDLCDIGEKVTSYLNYC